MKIKPHRQQKLEDRHKGYTRLFKGCFLLLRSKTLTKSEFILWQFCYSVLADWDKRHDTFEKFDHTNKEIAYALGWHESTVSKNMTTLIEKNFIKEHVGLREVTDFGFLMHRTLKSSKTVISFKPEDSEISSELNEEKIDLDEIFQDMDRQEYLESLEEEDKPERSG